MTTPTSKSWGEDYSSLFTFEQGFVCPVCRIARPTNGGITLQCPTVTEDGACNGQMMTNLMYARDYGKQFISSLLEQERKDERQRVLSEVVEELTVICCYVKHNYGDDCLHDVITKLNQLKEE